jgi:diguanylate cyclase (GGDEF)-like protein
VSARRRRRAPNGARQLSDDLLDAGRTIMTAGDLVGFLRATAEQVGRLVGDEGAVLVDGRCWAPPGRQLPPSGPIDRVMSTGRSLRTDDTTVVPIVADGRVVGALVSWSRRSDAEETLGAFAPLVGAALQGVRTRIEHEHLALDDGLTGVGNRRRFDRDLDRFVGVESGRGVPVALAMVDVDHFKRFNDTYGHQIGDAVLQHVARVISASVRVGDLVYRYGGEEFAVLLPGADLEDAVGVAERVRSAIASSPLPGDALAGVAPVTVSVGVSMTPPADAAAIVRGADGALYAAKSGGRNRVEVFAPS